MATVIEFSTHDPERALPTLEEYFPGVRMSNPRGGFTLDLVAAAVEAISVVDYRLQSPSSSSSADLSENLSFGKVSAGSVGMTTLRDQIDTSQPWLFPQHRVHADWDDVTITALTLSRAATLRMVEAQTGFDDKPFWFTGTRPIDGAHAIQWSALVDYTATALADESSAMSSPLVRSSAFAHLVAMAFETFPNSLSGAVHHQGRPAVLPRSLRRAMAFMDENAHLPIIIEDVARESHMSLRALQYAFSRFLESTPRAYLRLVRLSGAHRDLRGADPTTGATVMSICTEWGFAHPGRFARQYREVYGVSPRSTLES